MFLYSIFLRLLTLPPTTQAYEQKHKNDDYHFVLIGSTDWNRCCHRLHHIQSIDKSKPSYAKDQQCFEELKEKLTPDEMMEITKKKTMTQSHCDFL